MVEKFEYDLNWKYYLRLFVFYSFLILAIFSEPPSWKAIIFLITYLYIGGIGITVGAHRCISHHSFKANKLLKFILLMCQTISFQRSAIDWTVKHRLHHKYTDTEADPHSPIHGWRVARCTWAGCKHTLDEVKNIFKINISDLESDPLICFQHKYYIPLVITLNFLLPLTIGTQIIGENFITMWHYNVVRMMYFYHSSMIINFLGHSSTKRPYDKSTSSSESLFSSLISLGEGWHNFHHAFPSDYKCKESHDYFLNGSKAMIDFFAFIGWATELKTVSDEIVRERVLRTGDGSHRYAKEKNT